MRLRIQFVGIPLLLCAAAVAQDQVQPPTQAQSVPTAVAAGSSVPSCDAYCQHLKRMAEGKPEPRSAKGQRSQNQRSATQTPVAQPASAVASSEQQSRDAYREQLRRMSGDTGVRSADNRVAAAKSEQPAVSTASTQSTSSITHRPASTAVVSDENPNAIQPTPAVSKSVVEQPAPATAFAPQPDANPNSPADTAYRNDLRSFAAGDPHAAPMVVLAHPEARNTTTVRNFVKNVAFDQIHIWESPFKLRDSDATWAVPFGIAAGSLVATDHDLSKQLATPSRQDISKKISDAGLFGSIGVGAGIYALGAMTGDDHKRETGLLSGEAFVNATLVAEALKYAVGRQRPFEADGFGHIGKGGSSFPSEHAIGTFAIATVVAHEYPNPFIQLGAYGIASAVAASRVTAGQHFPSDVLVGSAFGYLIGRKIYNDHHNGELGGAEYGTFVKEQKPTTSIASAYVPLDSWVYPAIERLAAWGYIQSEFLSLRPWTRTECARLLGEVSESLDDPAKESTHSQAEQIYSDLSLEFHSEVESSDAVDRPSVVLDSIYSRSTAISGKPLTDGFHFGQSIIDDFGRPYEEGFNNYSGVSGFGHAGPLAFYIRGEYQETPSAPALSASVRQVIADLDTTPGGTPVPVLPGDEFAATNRFRLLDAYASLNLGGYQLSFGKQTLWWGPSEGGPMLFSDNTEPIPMLRISNTSPVQLPSIGRLLGPVRVEAFLGQLDGQSYVANGQQFDQIVTGPDLSKLIHQPYVNGQKFSFKPTPNFEFSVSRTAIIGGEGAPLTFGSFERSFFNLSSGSEFKVGDRRSGADFNYKIPGLRDWLLFYADAFTDDEVSPLVYPRKAAMSGGIYLSHIPKFRRLDFRAEGGYTDVPNQPLKGFFFWNRHYLSGYTNDGNLLGSWIGRDGQGVQLWSTYWFSPKTTLQFNYRHQYVNHGFLPGGGMLTDGGVRATIAMGKSWSLLGSLEYEDWNFPVLAPQPQADIVTTFQLTFRPGWRIR